MKLVVLHDHSHGSQLCRLLQLRRQQCNAHPDLIKHMSCTVSQDDSPELQVSAEP